MGIFLEVVGSASDFNHEICKPLFLYIIRANSDTQEEKSSSIRLQYLWKE